VEIPGERGGEKMRRKRQRRRWVPTKPFQSVEESVADYVKQYLATEDPYR
jgi:hypothetical protein